MKRMIRRSLRMRGFRFLPREATRERGPRLVELAEDNNAAKVIRVVGGEANELVAYRHDPGGRAWTGRAAYIFVKVSGLASGGGGLLRGLEEALG